MKKKAKAQRKLQPENWAAILGYGEALQRFGETSDPSELRGTVISHKRMGEALTEIAYGKDAREVFGQTRAAPGRQSLDWFHGTIAFYYFGARAKDGLSHKDACQRVMKQFEWTRRKLKPESIARYARKYQRSALNDLDRSGMDTTKLRVLLATKAKGTQEK